MSAPVTALRIRVAALADLAALAALETGAFEEPWTAEAIASYWQGPGAQGWLAESADGDPVGFALFRVVPEAQEAELLRVATAPPWRRRQVASRLLTAALTTLDRQSIDTFLEVRADNRPAQELYRRLGFEYQNQRRSYYPDGCDAWIYHRPS